MKNTLLSMAVMVALMAGSASQAAEPAPAKSEAQAQAQAQAQVKPTAKPTAKSSAKSSGKPAALAAIGAAAGPATLSPEAAKRRADIDFWLAKYDGADLRAGANGCRAPRIPAVSKQNDEIDRVAKSYAAWDACHKAYVAALAGEAPLSKMIPPELKKQMSEAEVAQATKHLVEVHTQLMGDAAIDADVVKADYAAWRSATNNYVKDFKAVLKAAEAQEKNMVSPIPQPLTK